MDIDKSIHLAFQYYEAGNFPQAKHIYTEILKEQPNSEIILYMLGIVHAQLEEYDLAIQHMERVLQLNKSNADAYLALGGMYQKKGLFDEAIHCYRKAIELDPDFAEAHENLGDIFREKHNLDEAITHYKKAIQLNPHSAEIPFHLGNIFKEKGQFDLATFYYRTALKYKPDYAEVYNNLGNIFHDQRRLDEAIGYYQKALQFNPNLAEASMNLGDAFHEKRQFDEAIKYHQYRSEVTIKIGFMKVEMMINAVINQFYFRTLNVQFYPDIYCDKNYTLGLKRQILEKIFNDTKKIENINKFFSDLDRLNTIREYYANRHLETMPLQNENTALPYNKKNDNIEIFEKLHHEFMFIEANIENQLVKVLHSL